MRIKILDSNTRCPYCGTLAVLPAKPHPFGAPHQRCKVCGKEYTFQYRIGIEILWFWFGWSVQFGIRSLMESYDMFIFIIILFLLFWQVCYPPFWMHYSLKPLEKIRWGICSSYDIILKINSLDRKYFKKNMIYPICFIDDNSMPISKYCCIKVTEIKNKGKTAYCVITDLPLGEKINKEWIKNDFRIFFDKRIIGTGRILQ